MSYDYSDEMEDTYSDYMANEYPIKVHEDAIRYYLGVHGDAIDKKLDRLQKTANEFIKQGVYDFALVVTGTALEIIIKYFCVKPLVEGAFLSELWASELAKRLIDIRIAENRGLFVKILKNWGIDVDKIEVTPGKKLWGTITGPVLTNRNKVIHRGDPMKREEAEVGFNCLIAMRKEVVGGIAKHFDFTLDKTGCWHKVIRTTPHRIEQSYGMKDPF